MPLPAVVGKYRARPASAPPQKGATAFPAARPSSPFKVADCEQAAELKRRILGIVSPLPSQTPRACRGLSRRCRAAAAAAAAASDPDPAADAQLAAEGVRRPLSLPPRAEAEPLRIPVIRRVTHDTLCRVHGSAVLELAAAVDPYFLRKHNVTAGAEVLLDGAEGLRRVSDVASAVSVQPECATRARGAALAVASACSALCGTCDLQTAVGSGRWADSLRSCGEDVGVRLVGGGEPSLCCRLRVAGTGPDALVAYRGSYSDAAAQATASAPSVLCITQHALADPQRALGAAELGVSAGSVVCVLLSSPAAVLYDAAALDSLLPRADIVVLTQAAADALATRYHEHWGVAPASTDDLQDLLGPADDATPRIAELTRDLPKVPGSRLSTRVACVVGGGDIWVAFGVGCARFSGPVRSIERFTGGFIAGALHGFGIAGCVNVARHAACSPDVSALRAGASAALRSAQ